MAGKNETIVVVKVQDLPKVNQVVSAWLVPGRHPDYHARMKRKLRTEWPALAAALDQLAAP